MQMQQQFFKFICNTLRMSFKDSAQETANGYYSANANSIIRMELKDGIYHEDIGTGSAEGLSSMATIIIQAKEVTFSFSF